MDAALERWPGSRMARRDWRSFSEFCAQRNNIRPIMGVDRPLLGAESSNFGNASGDNGDQDIRMYATGLPRAFVRTR
jgi:hypothetical protein